LTLKRNDLLSSDKAETVPVIKNVLEELKKENKVYDYIVLLQPTSPLRDEDDIDEAFELLFNNDVTAIISVNEINNKVLKSFVQDDKGYMKGISSNDYPFQSRQSLPSVYNSNGAIYIISVKEFNYNNSLLTTKTLPYIMSDIKSLDIDTLDDLDKVKKEM